ncbi:MAG: hypothetical protein ABR973_06205 [Candidatus Acidiferrales bacterium]|jgi:hypothetical protein
MTTKTVGEIGFAVGRVPFLCPNDQTPCAVIGSSAYEFRCGNCGAQWNRGDDRPYQEGGGKPVVANVFTMRSADPADSNPDAPDRDQ